LQVTYKIFIPFYYLRLGTGFTDEALIQITESLKDFQMQEKPSRYAVSKALKPDVWFLPSQVSNKKYKNLHERCGKLNVTCSHLHQCISLERQ